MLLPDEESAFAQAACVAALNKTSDTTRVGLPVVVTFVPFSYGMSRSLRMRLEETLKAYWYLGFTSFGGPGVHVYLLHNIFVSKLRWVDEKTFTDLFTISNALPGPGSTQLAFSIALVRNGTLAGVLSFLCWSYVHAKKITNPGDLEV